MLALIADSGGADTQLAAGYPAFLVFLFIALPAHVFGFALVIYLVFRYQIMKGLYFATAYYTAWVVMHLIFFLPTISTFGTNVASEVEYNILHGDEKELIELVRFRPDEAAVQALINDGVDVNAVDKHFGISVLGWAAGGASTEILKILLGAGADPNLGKQMPTSYLPRNLVQSDAFLPLPNAVSLTDDNERFRRTQLLLKYGADPDRGFAILVACARGDLKIIQMLLDHGADLQIRDLNENTCAHLAASENHVPVLKYLVQKDFDLSNRTRYRQTSLDLALKDWKGGAALYLMQQGFHPSREDLLSNYLDNAPETEEKAKIRLFFEDPQ